MGLSQGKEIFTLVLSRPVKGDVPRAARRPDLKLLSMASFQQVHTHGSLKLCCRSEWTAEGRGRLLHYLLNTDAL